MWPIGILAGMLTLVLLSCKVESQTMTDYDTDQPDEDYQESPTQPEADYMEGPIKRRAPFHSVFHRPPTYFVRLPGRRTFPSDYYMTKRGSPFQSSFHRPYTYFIDLPGRRTFPNYIVNKRSFLPASPSFYSYDYSPYSSSMYRKYRIGKRTGFVGYDIADMEFLPGTVEEKQTEKRDMMSNGRIGFYRDVPYQYENPGSVFNRLHEKRGNGFTSPDMDWRFVRFGGRNGAGYGILLN